MSKNAASTDRADVRTGYLRTDGWAGRMDWAIFIVGETPKKYRIQAAVGDIPMPGRRPSLKFGEKALVPKHAVRFS